VKPKALLRTVRDGEHTYKALLFVCPGCVADGHTGVHMLPVQGETGIRARWDWDGSLAAATLNPSILTTAGPLRCHSFLRAGVFEFLSDCSHSLAGQHVPMPDLYDWLLKE